MEQAHRSNLLQLADMVAGSVAKSCKTVNSSNEYLRVIKGKQASVRVWPVV